MTCPVAHLSQLFFLEGTIGSSMLSQCFGRRCSVSGRSSKHTHSSHSRTRDISSVAQEETSSQQEVARRTVVLPSSTACRTRHFPYPLQPCVTYLRQFRPSPGLSLYLASPCVGQTFPQYSPYFCEGAGRRPGDVHEGLLKVERRGILVRCLGVCVSGRCVWEWEVCL